MPCWFSVACASGSMKFSSAQQPRRRGRVEDVAGHGQHERREEAVAQQRIGLVAPDVDPDHEAEGDRELALEVRELRHLHDEVGRLERPVLHGVLLVDAEHALGVHHIARVLERRLLAALRERARELVGDVERDEDRELAREPGPAVREQRADPAHRPEQGMDHGAHATGARVRPGSRCGCYSGCVSRAATGADSALAGASLSMAAKALPAAGASSCSSCAARRAPARARPLRSRRSRRRTARASPRAAPWGRPGRTRERTPRARSATVWRRCPLGRSGSAKIGSPS